MSNDNFVVMLAIVGIIVAGVAIWFVSRKRAAQRAAGLKALADQWLFVYSPQSETAVNAVQKFRLGSRGRGHTATNLITGSRDGVDVQLFDHYFKIGYGRNTQHIRTSVVMLRSSRLSLPFFTLRSRGIFEGLKKAFGRSKAIKIEGDAAFNKAYLVTGGTASDEMAIQALFDLEKQHFFVGKKKLTVEGDGSMLIVYRERKRPKPAEMSQLLEDALAVAGVFSAESNWG